MPKKIYNVRLSQSERKELSHLASTTKGAPQKIKNALILLAVDRGEYQETFNTDERIAEILDIDRGRIYRVKRDCVEHSIEVALTGKTEERGHHPRALTGEQEARLIALACGNPPVGHSQWSVRLLASKVIELRIADSVSYTTVSRILKKTRSSRG
ncbi:MAG: helix-turn-helix domain-containing protein [Victivallales bacterium]|nr:helix-turn-helix domain-containing protein [Victivallales bacterium]